jgi:integrase
MPDRAILPVVLAVLLFVGAGALAAHSLVTNDSLTLSLPAFLVAELEAHLERYSTNPELVFAGRDGGPLRRNNFRRRVWVPAVERTGLEGLRFHDLRHTAASLMIANNVHPKVIQSRLGHSSIGVTMDTYGHLLPSLDEEVAEGLESARRTALFQPPATHVPHDQAEW